MTSQNILACCRKFRLNHLLGVTIRIHQSPKRGKILATRLASLRESSASPRFASCSYLKSLPRLASPRGDLTSPRLASLRLLEIMHNFTPKIPYILRTCVKPPSILKDSWSYIMSLYKQVEKGSSNISNFSHNY